MGRTGGPAAVPLERAAARARPAGAAGGATAAPAARPARAVVSLAASRYAGRSTARQQGLLEPLHRKRLLPVQQHATRSQLGRRRSHASLTKADPCDDNRTFLVAVAATGQLPQASARAQARRDASADDDEAGPRRAEPATAARGPAPGPERRAGSSGGARLASDRRRPGSASSRGGSTSSRRWRPGRPRRRGRPPRSTTEHDPSADAENIATVLAHPGFLISGYAQGQFLASRASQDQLQQGGASLNQDTFTVPPRPPARRPPLDVRGARAGDRRQHEPAGSTSGCGAPRRRCSGIRDGTGAPLAMLTVGHVLHAVRLRAARAGAHPPVPRAIAVVDGAVPGQCRRRRAPGGSWRFLRYAIALVNGEPIAEGASRPFRGDPNAAKDLVVRLGADTTPAPPLRIAGGVSLPQGKGFHPGTDATKQRHDLARRTRTARSTSAR